MYYRQKTLTRMGAPRPRTINYATVPASVGGINALDSAMGMPAQDCFYCHNLVPSEYALRLRKGFREWARIPTGKSVQSLVPFEGQASDASQDRLWAVTEDGIYNITTFGEINPNHDVVFSVQTTGEAGHGVWTEFTNDATNRFLQYADAENGLWEYSEDTALWTQPTITGPDVTRIAYVFGWKNRLWYIEQDSGDAWYLSPDSNSGNATKFTFGSKFKHGGELKALYSWTRDGGEGVDDFLIAISRGGDVLIYKGSDPSQPDFGLVGSFYIGEVPESRRLAVDYGSDLFLLSTYGLTSIKELLAGVGVGSGGPSAKINRFLRNDVVAGKDDFTWGLVVHPADGFLQIYTPYNNNRSQDAIQYVQNLLTGGWGMWRGVPVNTAENWNDDYYFGDKNGSVWLYTGTLDNHQLDNPDQWDTAVAQVNGPEWVEAPAGTYTCDGTQVGDTTWTEDLLVATTPGVTYECIYTISAWVAGKHTMQLGGTAMAPRRSGNGIFTGTFTATSAETAVQLYGDVDFTGEFSAVVFREQTNRGEAIQYDILTSFQAPNGDHATYKRCGLIRTIGVLAGTSGLNIQAVYDYAIETQIAQPALTPSQGDNVWDMAVWDEDLWDFTVEGASVPMGALGMGRVIAVGMAGNASTRLNIIGWDISYTQGDFL